MTKTATSGVTASATSVNRQFSVNITASMPAIVSTSITMSRSDVDAKSCTALSDRADQRTNLLPVVQHGADDDREPAPVGTDEPDGEPIKRP
jgi:hypothetical protein